MSIIQRLLLISILLFLVFGFAHQSKAESAGNILEVPDNYALVGFGYGSDDKACTLYWKEGRLNADGTIGEIDSGWHAQACVDLASGQDRNGDDPIPSSARQKQAPAGEYLT